MGKVKGEVSTRKHNVTPEAARLINSKVQERHAAKGAAAKHIERPADMVTWATKEFPDVMKGAKPFGNSLGLSRRGKK